MRIKQWLLIGLAVFLLIAVTVLAVVLIKVGTADGDTTKDSKDLREIVGKDIALSECITYCSDYSEEKLSDEFSKVYSDAVAVTVMSIDEEADSATIIVNAPPLKEILEDCLPDDTSGDFETLFDSYMKNVYKSISDYPSDDFTTTIVTCGIVDDEGLKFVINNDLTDAIFPNIQQLLAELLMETLVAEEE